MIADAKRMRGGDAGDAGGDDADEQRAPEDEAAPGRNDAPPLHIVPPLSVALNRGADLESPEGDPAVLKKGTPVDVKGEVTLPDGKVRLHLIHYESKGYGNKKVFK